MGGIPVRTGERRGYFVDSPQLPPGRRRGIGSTLAYVLLLLGIALLLILGSDRLGRGSRMSLQKAQALAHIDQIGWACLDEVFLAYQNRNAMVNAVVGPIAALGSGAVPAANAGGGPLQPLALLLQMIAPVPVGQAPPALEVHPKAGVASEPILYAGHQTGLVWINGQANTAAFGTGSTDVVITVVRKAHQTEIDSGELVIGTAHLKPVLYRYDGTPATSGGHTGGGVARAQLQITFRPPRATYGNSVAISRTYTSEHMFSLVMNDAQSSWSISVDTDPWRMEAIDD